MEAAADPDRQAPSRPAGAEDKSTVATVAKVLGVTAIVLIAVPLMVLTSNPGRLEMNFWR